MNEDTSGFIIILFLLCVLIGMPAGCTIVQTSSQGEKVCIEAKAKKFELAECEPIMADKAKNEGINSLGR